MKHINIPAQITTVEDRIVGDLSLTQLGLMVLPIFTSFAFYAGLPTPMKLNPYKLIIDIFNCLIFFSLSLRLKGKLVLFWLIMLSQYHLRPKLYLFNKNSSRANLNQPSKTVEIENKVIAKKAKALKPLNKKQLKADKFDLKLNLNFIEAKKGKLYVYVNQPK